MLYRVYPAIPGAELTGAGGPLFVPRLDQGAGRHDNPEVYGALYASREPAAPIAEFLKDYLAEDVTELMLRREGFPISLATFDDSGLPDLPTLDEPRTLLDRELRPSRVATRNREWTQPLGLTMFEEGHAGFAWWSTIESSWINVTLFAERVLDRLELVEPPGFLTIEDPLVMEAADAVGVLLP